MVDENTANPWGDDADEKEAAVSSGGDFQDIEHFKPVVGENVIRIVGTYKWFKEYWLPRVKRSVIQGPEKDCPIFNNPEKQKLFDKGKKLKDAGKEKEAKEVFKKAYQTYVPNVKYAVNVLDRADGTVKIWKFSRTIKERIMTFGKKYGDPNKYDLVLTRKDTGLNTKYVLDAEREQVPLTEEEKNLKTFNLNTIFKPTPLERVQSYLKGVIPSKEKDSPATAVATQDTPVGDAPGLSDSEVEELNNLGDESVQ